MIKINNKDYKELRCAKCQKFVIYQNIAAGIMAFQCPRCGYLNEWVFKYLKTEANEDMLKSDYSLITKLEGGE